MKFWRASAEIIGRRYKVVILVAVLLAAVTAFGLPRLEFATGQDSIIPAGSQVYKDNLVYQAQFGGEPMLALWTGPIEEVFSEENLPRIQAVEQALIDDGRFAAVLGPHQSLQYAADQLPILEADLLPATIETVGEEARQEALAGGATEAEADAAAAEASAARTDELLAEAARLNEAAPTPEARTFANPEFVKFLLYEGDGDIRPILRDNFPDPNHALMIVRLPGNAELKTLGPDSDLVRELVDQNALSGFDSVVSGPPRYLKDINDYLQGGMATLGGIAVLVMVVVLALVFRVRWRLLSLAIVTVGSIWAFGIMGFVDIPLSMVTISGFPILIGLGVDFSIQMHSRFEEEVTSDGDANRSRRMTMMHMGPPLLVAMLAAAIGFLALQLSQVPMIRTFGWMLVIGVIALVTAAIFLPTSFLTWREHAKPTVPHHGAVRSKWLERVVGALTSMKPKALGPIMLVGVAIIVGWVLTDGQFTIQTDPEKWVNQQSDTIKELKELREGTGFSSELGVLIEAPDVSATEVQQWMNEFAAAQVSEHPAVLLRYTSLPAIVQAATNVAPTKESLDALLPVTPEQLRISFLNDDLTKANLVFPIGPVSLDERRVMLEEFEADLNGDLAPPEGVTATPSGLGVTGVQLVKSLEANRTTMTWLALGLVALWLLVFYRSIAMMVLPLIPVMIAVGLSSIAIFLMGLELSPLTTVTGPLVIAVCTEFTVLIQTRYVEERQEGRHPEEAVRIASLRIGRAFVASGLTLLGGFGVLAFSSLPLLRDFGIVVAVKVLAALLSALVVLPPLLVYADKHQSWTRFHPQRGHHKDQVPEAEQAVVASSS